MAESLEQRLQRSLADADAMKAERARAAAEEARAKEEAERQRTEKEAAYGAKYDELHRAVWNFKSTLERQPDVMYRMKIDGKPNPSPHLRSCNVAFIEKNSNRSTSYMMHLTKNGIFQIGPWGSDVFSSPINEMTNEKIEDIILERFTAFSQPE